MIYPEGLPFIKDYISSINLLLSKKKGNTKLSALQQYWLKFVLLGILVTNSICWSRLERFSLGCYKMKALSWMFRQAKISWGSLLLASVSHILKVYKVHSGILLIDDSDCIRSKSTPCIAKTHKLKDKKTNGYINGQNLVFLLLVSNGITIPVGYALYMPDPELKKYKDECVKLRKNKVSKHYYPPKPIRSKDFPTKIDIALTLMQDFVQNHPTVKIGATVVDTLYNTRYFIDNASRITKQKQVITQIKSIQNIIVNNKLIQVKEFFKRYHGTKQVLQLRGQYKMVRYVNCKFTVKSHGVKYRLIALKYDNEESFRYLIANDMSWHPIDIIQTYALRWLIEVFIQDWKSYEGWNNLAKQLGTEGTTRAVILSLLCDHVLLTHPNQKALFKKREPACTVGSLRERVMLDSLLAFIKSIIYSDNPKALFEQHQTNINQIFTLRSSTKHMRNIDMRVFREDTYNNVDINNAA